MRFSGKILLILIIIGSIKLFEIGTIESNSQVSGYIESGVISIQGDSLFENYSSSGNGTRENPYIIENYNVTVSTPVALSVQSTTKYFIVRNCLFSATYHPVLFANIKNGTGVLYNNTITGAGNFGVFLSFGTEYCTISNNRIRNTGQQGMHINSKSNGNKIINNTFVNQNIGIYLQFSHENIIANNTIDTNSKGIVLENAKNFIYNNTITDLSSYGVHIIGPQTTGSKVIGNSFVDILDTQAIYAVAVNLEEIHYLRIEGNIFRNIYCGFYSFASFDMRFINNSFYNVLVIGISTDYTDNNTVRGNKFVDSRAGVYLSDRNNIIENNLFYNCTDYGARTEYGARYNNNTFIKNKQGINGGSVSGSGNDFINNTWGIRGGSISLQKCNFIGNNIGIETGQASLSNNSFINNTGWAVDVDSGTIYLNVFVDNNPTPEYPHQTQAAGDAYWYHLDLEIGNWWSDWNGEGYYYIYGSYLGGDRFPLPYDRDEDGLPDFWEENNDLDKYTNDSFLDYDLDNLTNLEEFLIGTKANDPDSDNDSLLDGEEVLSYLTDPLNFDSDFDLLSDGEEVNIYFTNPLQPDSDQDGLEDGLEILVYFTDALNADCDEDKLVDGQEVLTYQTDPWNNDTDSDNYSDYDEIMVYGTDPLNPESYPTTEASMSSITIISSLIIVYILYSYTMTHNNKKKSKDK